VRSVLLPSLIAQIPAFSVMGQGRRSISLPVDFLSPAERHAGSEVKRPLAFSVPTRARILCVAAFDFLCIGLFAQGREPASATGLKFLSQSPRLMSDTATAR
jgi:hypothetical protein